MAYIYKIINDINGKVQIGKTEFSIEKRFQEHCREYKKERCEKRPLYNAMNKYGIKHFHIELIEETDSPEEREKYWIEYYNSFKDGYNATLGGDGKKYLDYELIYNTYLNCKNVKKTACLCKCSEDSVTSVLNLYKVSYEERIKNRVTNRKVVMQYDLEGNYIQSFSSLTEASLSLTGKIDGKKHISEVCHNKRKTAYGYFWKFANN